MEILIPVRYPLTDRNERAIRRGLALAEREPNSELLVFHMNELHKGERIDRSQLRESVEWTFGSVNATYVVRDGFLYEEAIVEAAVRYGVDIVLLSRQRKLRWQWMIEEILDLDVDLERFLRDRLGITIELVS